MRTFTCSAQYERFLVDAITRLIAEAGRDADWRADEIPRYRALASVPDDLYDAEATGNVVLMVGVVNADVGPATVGEALRDVGCLGPERRIA